MFDITNVILSNRRPRVHPRGRQPHRGLAQCRRRPRPTHAHHGGRTASQSHRRPHDRARQPPKSTARRCTDDELASFFVLLASPATRPPATPSRHGLRLLTENPDQRAWWMEDFEGRIAGGRRGDRALGHPGHPLPADRDDRDGARLGDQEFNEGDKVVLSTDSANRDEAVFDGSVRLRPEPRRRIAHVGFGGPGPHFCLGAHLARREITVMFRELLHRLPDIDGRRARLPAAPTSSTASST